MKPQDVIVSGLDEIEGYKTRHVQIVQSSVVLGANFVKDFFAKISDVVGGRSSSYEKTCDEGIKQAIENLQGKAAKLGANAILKTTFEYNSIGEKNTMITIHAYGTAVVLSEKDK
ncbi:YbjQ family protein [Pseudoalteromonas marina]|uniref:UPF0145 protein Q8W34_14505 n=1 Tax=Pseudoalteromonas marina TaxID=267375 RepID=A0ABT9FGE2_9GAMM|nr:YbjQ family protein [Pseudoalteromonas marina]MDP2565855.1 YbjQ family protein [Pseudoalteromonas marina]